MGERLDGTLGAAVREQRIAENLTQAHLARLADVSRRHLAALERGANVSVLVVVKVARALQVSQLPLGNIVLTGAPTAVPRISDALDALSEIERLTAQARGALNGASEVARIGENSRGPSRRKRNASES